MNCEERAYVVVLLRTRYYDARDAIAAVNIARTVSCILCPSHVRARTSVDSPSRADEVGMKRVSGGVDDGFGERGGVVGVRAPRARGRGRWTVQSKEFLRVVDDSSSRLAEFGVGDESMESGEDEGEIVVGGGRGGGRVRQGALRRGIFGHGIENGAYSGQRASERAPGQRHRSSSKRSAKSLSHGGATRETVAWFRQRRRAGEQFLSPPVKGTGRNRFAEKL